MSKMAPRFLPLAVAALFLLSADARPVDAQTAASAPHPTPGWIGVQVNGNEVRQMNGRVQTDLEITSVVDGSPADRAGFQPGDRIVRLNGRSVTLDSFVRAASNLRSGDRVRLMIARGPWTREMDIEAVARPAQELVGLPQDVAVRVDSALVRLDSLLWLLTGPATPPGRRPMSAEDGGSAVQRLVATGPDSSRTVILPTWGLDLFPGAPSEVPGVASGFPTDGNEAASSWSAFFRQRGGPDISPDDQSLRVKSPHILGQNRVAGAAVILLNPELAAYFEVETGLLVTDVTPGTPADDAGVRPGDVVVLADQAPVTSVADLRRALSARGPAPTVLGLVRQGEPVDVTLPR